MAIDLWKDDDEEISGDYVAKRGGGDLPLIPVGTLAMANIDQAIWAGDNHISMQFDIEVGKYKGRRIFKKFVLKNAEETQIARDYAMFLAIDKNAGGRIRKLGREPYDQDMAKYLVGKSVTIIIGQYKGKLDGKMMNCLDGVSSMPPPRESDDDDKDIPW